MEAWQITLIVAFLLALAEVVTGAFLFLGLGVGAVAVALAQWLGGGLSLNRDLLLFAACATAAVLGFRRVFRKPDDQQAPDGDVNRY